MAMASGGLVMTLATGQLSPLHAQGDASVEADASIIREVTVKNLLEIRFGELTRTLATSPSVRRFGDQMIADHSYTHQQWSAVVDKDGKPFKPSLGQMQLGEVRRLEKVPRAEFDREYMATMIRHHQEDVRFFQNAANSARSTRVRELLASGLPVLQQHLSLALQVGSQVGAAPAVATGPNVPADLPPANPNYPGSQNPPPTTSQNQPAPSQNLPVASEEDRKAFKKDIKFVREAIADNTLEIRLAQLAEKKTTHRDVRRLAGRMLSDHTAMQRQWLSLAARNGMNLKPGMGKRHLEKAKRLEKMSAPEFDEAYTTMEIQNNQDYAEYFQKEGKATHSPEVRSQAANNLLSIREHLAGAKKVGDQLGIDTEAALRARNLSSYKK
jgi:putative membrane protein